MISDNYDQALSEENRAFVYRKIQSPHCANKLRCLQDSPLTEVFLFTKVFFLMNGRYWDLVTPALAIRIDTTELLDICYNTDSNCAQVP